MPSSSPETTATTSRYRSIPSVAWLLDEIGSCPIEPSVLTDLIRQEIDVIRHEIADGEAIDRASVLDRCRRSIDALLATRLTPVINGTGILLHTNLGRAPVSRATAEAMAQAATGYLSLEIEPQTNQRGGRMDEISRLLRALTGSEATLVVNNNAAAVLLVLTALCAGKEVIVSRGEAVEIGGGFRIPDVVAQSGCRLVEVGATNRTYVSDYVSARTPETGALLKVHTSNFRIEGFTARPTTRELASIANELGTIVMEDLGSGSLLDTSRFDLRAEPTVAEAIAAGASVVTFSGDKLLGGPQAGIICGKRELIRRIERHPLARAVRADKTALAGLSATLRHYLAGEAVAQIPIWQMIATPVDLLRARAEAIVADRKITIVESEASIGGGSMPGETVPSIALELEAENVDLLARRLRTGSPAVFPVVRQNSVRIDLRTVHPEQDAVLAPIINNL